MKKNKIYKDLFDSEEICELIRKSKFTKKQVLELLDAGEYTEKELKDLDFVNDLLFHFWVDMSFKRMKRRFLCIWSKPYNVDINIESDGSIFDENRGFTDIERNQIEELEPLKMLKLDGIQIIRIK